MLWIWLPDTVGQQDLKTILPVVKAAGVKYDFIDYAVTDEGEYASLPPDSVYDKLGPDDVLLALGTVAVQLLQVEQTLPKGRVIKSLRDKVWPLDEGHVVVSYSPRSDPQYIPLLQWDIQLAIRQIKTGTAEPETGDYKWVEDFHEIVDYVKKNYDGAPIPVALDTETIGLDPFFLGNFSDPDNIQPAARIVSISLTAEVGTAHVYYVPEDGKLPEGLRLQLQALCTSKKIKMVGANLKYDAVWMLHHWGIAITNQKFDTLLVGSLLNENVGNSLNLHAKMYTDMGGYDDAFNSKYDKSRMDLVPKDDLLPYAGGDTDACLRVYETQKSMLREDSELLNLYVKLVQRSSDVFTKLEYRGVVVDVERYKELEAEVLADHTALNAEGLSLIPKKIRIKHLEKGVTLTRPALIKDYMFGDQGLKLKPKLKTPKTGQPSTSKDHFLMFADHPKAGPFIDVYSRFSSAQKTLSTYIVGFMKFIRSDGKFHPTYFLGRSDAGGTNTGRSSCKGPAYQTNLKHTPYAQALRTVYTCPEGYAILKADYQQGELRITACVADEPNMLEAYANNVDLHLKSGANLNGISLEDAIKMQEDNHPKIAHIRQGGKVVNFGLIYTMGVKTLVEYARTDHGVILTDSQAAEAIDIFFETYPGLLTWHDDCRQLVRSQGFMRSPLGRVRHLPTIYSRDAGKRAQAERQAINSPVQGCLSDMCQLAMCELDKAYPDLWQFGFTHDEIQMYVPSDDVPLWANQVREVMENLPLDEFGWKPQLAFPVDIEYSYTNLAECQKYKG